MMLKSRAFNKPDTAQPCQFPTRALHNIAHASPPELLLPGLHRFQILPILQVPSTAIKFIYKYKYRYRYMEVATPQFAIIIYHLTK